MGCVCGRGTRKPFEIRERPVACNYEQCCWTLCEDTPPQSPQEAERTIDGFTRMKSPVFRKRAGLFHRMLSWPPSRHTGETYVVIRTTERVLAGTEIRWDYDMGEQTRTYREQLRAEGVPDADLDGAAYKQVRWAPPAELTEQQGAAARARRAGHAVDTQRAGPAGGEERANGRKRRNLQSRWDGRTRDGRGRRDTTAAGTDEA